MKHIALLCFILMSLNVMAQAPIIDWQKSYGGSKDEQLTSICQGPNGSYYLLGTTRSHDGMVSFNHDSIGITIDIWILNIDSAGTLLWEKTIGGSRNDYAECIVACPDGGIIICAATNSNDGDISFNHDASGLTFDSWIVKLSSSGAILWEKSYGGSKTDMSYKLIQTPDSGYISVGWTNSFNGDVSFNHDTVMGTNDVWVFKINASGALLWEKTYGGTGPAGEMGSDIISTFDGNYLIGASSGSSDGDSHHFHDNFTAYPNTDTWLIKINSVGDTLWERCYGGTGAEDMVFLCQLKDSSIAVVQRTWQSTDGDVHGNINDPFNDNVWVFDVKIGPDTIQWQKVTGGPYTDRPNFIFQKENGNIVVYAYSMYNGFDVTGNHGGFDFWIYELDSAHNFVWRKSIGGSLDETLPVGYVLSNTSYILAGASSSNNGNVSGNQGGSDFWFSHLSVLAPLAVEPLLESGMAFKVFPNPSNGMVNILFSDSYPECLDAVITVCDITGKEVYRKIGNAGMSSFVPLNLSGLSKGFYTVSLHSNNVVSTSKLILE